NAGLLQVEQHRTRDRSPHWTRAVGAGDHHDAEGVAALDVAVAEAYVVLESRHGVEDETAVGEADERLRLRRAIPLEARLHQMVAADQRNVVQDLNAGVVRLDRNEEWHAESEAIR